MTSGLSIQFWYHVYPPPSAPHFEMIITFLIKSKECHDNVVVHRKHVANELLHSMIENTANTNKQDVYMVGVLYRVRL